MTDFGDISLEVDGFKGEKKEKQYLTQKLLNLDSIDTSNLNPESKVTFRTVRKSAIQKIQTVLSTLKINLCNIDLYLNLPMYIIQIFAKCIVTF